MMKRIFAAAAISALAAGCASMDEIRAMKPVDQGTFAGDYRSLSVCVMRHYLATTGSPNLLGDANPYHLLTDEPNKTAYIVTDRSELKFMQIETGAIRVEYREPAPLLNVAPPVLRNVETCAAAQAPTTR